MNINNHNIDIQRQQESLKRRCHDSFYTRLLTPPPTVVPSPPLIMAKPPRLDGVDLVPAHVVPSVTVVLDGRSICHRVNLHDHASYQSLAKALRCMFADTVNVDDHHDHDLVDDHDHGGDDDGVVDLTNAVSGHIVAYEDLENDLLLAGDLNWKDFVRVARRIRILPTKSNLKKQKEHQTIKSTFEGWHQRERDK